MATRPSGQSDIAKAQLLLRILGVLGARGRVLVLVGTMLPRVFMAHMGINALAGLRGMLMPMLMVMQVGMLMNVQVIMFRYSFHSSLLSPKSVVP
jgi:hypothetical protein